MLVFISDLHFVDETAGKHNLPTSAFEKFLTSISVHAKKAKAKELKIVFLGDIFDILRTEAWFAENRQDRPWGNNTVKMRRKALSILNAIHNKNKSTFDLFSKESLKARFKNIRVEPIYIPGNHDRLCWTISELRKKVTKLLDLNSDNPDNFHHHFIDTAHGVYATHGHCFDEFNYEGGPEQTPEDYELVPIGDPITTELVAKLPYVLMEKVRREGGRSKGEMEALKRNFQEIENVRPFIAILSWLLYQVASNKKIKDLIEDSVDETIKEFEKLKYVKKWYERHDKWYKPLDSADQIQGVLFVLEKFKVFSAGRLLDVIEMVKNLSSDYKFVKEAEKLFKSLDSRIQYIVMGHTHAPLQKALSCGGRGNATREHVYLNTGTWRKRYYECEDKSGFIGWKNMCYVILYKPEEKSNQYNLPVFETWSGALKREE